MEDYPDVDAYLAATEQWRDETVALRPILTGAGLDEAIKWGKPCYSHEGANVAIVQAFKDFLAVLFTKGALLDDPTGLLREQGPNTRSAKRLEFTSVAEIDASVDEVRALIASAIDAEQRGLEVGPAPEPELSPEFQERLAADPELSEAFDALTPGRRREYHLHVSSAKQSSTRASRVDKIAPRILAGKGLRDR